jgi:hypothetical protein
MFEMQIHLQFEQHFNVLLLARHGLLLKSNARRRRKIVTSDLAKIPLSRDFEPANDLPFLQQKLPFHRRIPTLLLPLQKTLRPLFNRLDLHHLQKNLQFRRKNLQSFGIFFHQFRSEKRDC